MRNTLYKRIAIVSATLTVVDSVSFSASFSAGAVSNSSFNNLCPVANGAGCQFHSQYHQYQSNGQQPEKRVPTSRESPPPSPVGRTSAGTASNVLVATDEDY